MSIHRSEQILAEVQAGYYTVRWATDSLWMHNHTQEDALGISDTLLQQCEDLQLDKVDRAHF